MVNFVPFSYPNLPLRFQTKSSFSDLGVHIDGLAAVVAHTFVVGTSSGDGSVTGRKADVILAAYHAAEACVRLIKPGNEVGRHLTSSILF